MVIFHGYVSHHHVTGAVSWHFYLSQSQVATWPMTPHKPVRDIQKNHHFSLPRPQKKNINCQSSIEIYWNNICLMGQIAGEWNVQGTLSRCDSHVLTHLARPKLGKNRAWNSSPVLKKLQNRSQKAQQHYCGYMMIYDPGSSSALNSPKCEARVWA